MHKLSIHSDNHQQQQQTIKCLGIKLPEHHTHVVTHKFIHQRQFHILKNENLEAAMFLERNHSRERIKRTFIFLFFSIVKNSS